MKRILFSLLLFMMAVKSHALFTAGGYVPFGPSTQKDVSGSKNTFSLDPMIGVNTAFNSGFYDQLFMPEVAIAFNGSETEGYSKYTYLFLADFGYVINSQFIIRYGLGSVITHITGDWGTMTLNNGSSTSEYYLPDQSAFSWNTTVNLGVQALLDKEFSFRFETFLFSPFNNESRKMSYALSLLYYY